MTLEIVTADPAPALSDDADEARPRAHPRPRRQVPKQTALFHRDRGNGLVDRDTMVLNNRRLAWKIARKYLGHGLEWEDLSQEAIAGLVKAVDRFDPHRGVAFSTYATFWIRQSIQTALAKGGSLIRTPARSSHGTRRGPRPTVHLVSLDAPARADTTIPLGDLIADPQSRISDPSDGLGRELLYAKLHELMDKMLTPREHEVIEAKFGLNDSNTPETLAQIAERLHLTHQRVQQILHCGVRRLKHGAWLEQLKKLAEMD